MKPTTFFKALLTQAFAVALVFSVSSASALTISPARAELTGDKGETISDTFLLINDQDSDQTYYTSVENFESQGESGTPNFTSSKEGLPSWVNVDAKITIKKGERVKVPYSITIPQGAESGGHFAAIFLSTVPPATDQNQVSVGAKVGMLILLRVTGDVKESGGLLSFELKDGKKLVTSLPVTFMYRFKNDGNDRVNPEGDIAVTNMIGGDVAHLDANKAKGNILPNSVRRFEVVYGEDVAPEVSAPFFDHVKFQYNHFAFGMYTASMKLSFGNKGVAETSLHYFVLPWQLLTVVLIVVLIGFFGLSFALKRYNQWIIKQARAAAKK